MHQYEFRVGFDAVRGTHNIHINNRVVFFEDITEAPELYSVEHTILTATRSSNTSMATINRCTFNYSSAPRPIEL